MQKSDGVAVELSAGKTGCPADLPQTASTEDAGLGRRLQIFAQKFPSQNEVPFIAPRLPGGSSLRIGFAEYGPTPPAARPGDVMLSGQDFKEGFHFAESDYVSVETA
jgi:hypothetical protein